MACTGSTRSSSSIRFMTIQIFHSKLITLVTSIYSTEKRVRICGYGTKRLPLLRFRLGCQDPQTRMFRKSISKCPLSLRKSSSYGSTQTKEMIWDIKFTQKIVTVLLVLLLYQRMHTAILDYILTSKFRSTMSNTEESGPLILCLWR
jgi:hypothetical protein